MKNSLKIVTLLVSVVMTMASCEGPMGPTGADGAKGDKGEPGDPGTTLACAECHNNNAQVPIFSAQWSTSIHATGGNAPYANRTGCVQCHTSQGFLEYVAEGSVADLSIPEHPSQISCYTCHNIHKSYSDDDWTLTKPGAQKLDVQYNGADIIWDKGSSNQCVSCHQERPVSPAPVVNGPDFAITSSRIGPHHGPNSNLILGKHPFELPGTDHPANGHSTSKGCVTCHMATPYGYQAGGHSMSLKYDSHGTELRLLTGCATCHDIGSSPYTAFNNKIEELQEEVAQLLEDLEVQLTAAGIYNPSTELAKTGTFKANAVLAYLNFNTVKEDRSLGMHNPEYIKSLLVKSIESMTALGYPAP